MIEEEIAKIIERSHPGCGLPKECNTECGRCGADQILALIPDAEYLLNQLKLAGKNYLDLKNTFDERLEQAKAEEREWFDSWYYNSDTEENPDGVEERYYYYAIPEKEYARHIGKP